MKLNINSIEKIRKEIEELILEVPDGMRITLDNDLLDSLIFFRLKCASGEPDIKIPIWTGEFLKKLDLSKLSFDNVWFNTGVIAEGLSYLAGLHGTSVSKYINYERLVKKSVERGSLETIMYFAPFVRPGIIDFSDTNIKINFSKLYKPDIHDTKFDNVDLSRSKGEKLEMISGCSFRNTGIKLDFDSSKLMIRNSDFSDNDFSRNTIGLEMFYDLHLSDEFNSYEEKSDYKNILSHLDNSNFSNTGLNIEFEKIEEFFRKLGKAYYEMYARDSSRYPDYLSGGQYGMTKSDVNRNNAKLNDDFKKHFTSLNNRFVIESRRGHFNGCYFCGQKIMSPEEKNANKGRLIDEYKGFEDKELRKVRDCFKKQISKKQK